MYKGIKTKRTTKYSYKKGFWKKMYMESIEVDSFDLDGNVVEYILYDQNGSLSKKSTNKFDSNGNVVEWLSYESDGLLEMKYIFKYDSNGNKVEESHYDPEENLKNDYFGVSKHIFKYLVKILTSWGITAVL